MFFSIEIHVIIIFAFYIFLFFTHIIKRRLTVKTIRRNGGKYALAQHIHRGHLKKDEY
jgi:hypothetical protein